MPALADSSAQAAKWTLKHVQGDELGKAGNSVHPP